MEGLWGGRADDWVREKWRDGRMEGWSDTGPREGCCEEGWIGGGMEWQRIKCQGWSGDEMEGQKDTEGWRNGGGGWEIAGLKVKGITDWREENKDDERMQKRMNGATENSVMERWIDEERKNCWRRKKGEIEILLECWGGGLGRDREIEVLDIRELYGDIKERLYGEKIYGGRMKDVQREQGLKRRKRK
jgi:hypothetical protein